MKLYQFDPFKHMTREESTVGALRAKAAHVDLSFLNSEGVIDTNKGGGVPTMGEISKTIAEAYAADSWADLSN